MKLGLVNRQNCQRYVILSAFVNVGCIDKEVITGLINLATESAGYVAAAVFTNIIHDALAPATHGSLHTCN